MLAKAELRQHLLVQRARLTPADIEQKSAVIAAYACSLLAFCVRPTVMVYMALPQEVQTMRIVAQARVWHKRIAVPVVQGDGLAAVELPDDPAQLRRGRFGILEPYETQAVISPEEIGYIIVPGVAFDYRGGRLGFGKGYYDRFLSRLPATTYRCGLAFGIQIVPYVPQTSHDICMHGIVTEQGFIPCMRALPARREGPSTPAG